MNNELKRIAENIAATPFESAGDIYHPIPFPEFDHLSTSSRSKSAYKKWDLIVNCLPKSILPKYPHVIDVGANAGFYTFSFAKQFSGRVDAYEPHTHYVNVGRQIADATALPVMWHNKPLELSDLNKQYDIALMLSVFQWISQGNTYLSEAVMLLNQMAKSAQILFFELGCNDGKSAIRTNERPIVWVWKLLAANTFPKTVSYLGTISAWGNANRYLFVCTNLPIRLTLRQRLITIALRSRLLR